MSNGRRSSAGAGGDPFLHTSRTIAYHSAMGAVAAEWHEGETGRPSWAQFLACWAFMVIGLCVLLLFQKNPTARIVGPGLAVLPCTILYGLRDRRQAASRIVESLADRQPYRVDVAILRSGTIAGTDYGALWFDDGLLNFKGLRTEFAIGPRPIVSNWSRG